MPVPFDVIDFVPLGTIYWLGIGLIVCAPVRYWFADIVCVEVLGVYVAAAFVVTLAVSDTEEFPAVPLDTYPADTVGVFETVLDNVKVFVLVDTVALVPLIVDAGVAEPLGTVTGEYACPVGAVYVPLALTLNASIMVCVPSSSLK